MILNASKIHELTILELLNTGFQCIECIFIGHDVECFRDALIGVPTKQGKYFFSVIRYGNGVIIGHIVLKRRYSLPCLRDGHGFWHYSPRDIWCNILYVISTIFVQYDQAGARNILTATETCNPENEVQLITDV
jgi:hypothetical protein